MAEYSDQVKAAALAALLAGQNPSEVARTFGIPVGTLVPIVNALRFLARIAGVTKRLNVVDAIRAALTNGDHMINRERFRLTTAQADVPIVSTQIKPLLFGVVAAVVVHTCAALATIHSAFERIDRTPDSIPQRIFIFGVLRALSQVRIRSEPFLVLILVLFAEGFVTRVSIAPVCALLLFLLIGLLSRPRSLVGANTFLALFRVPVRLTLVAAKCIEWLGCITAQAVLHCSSPIIVSWLYYTIKSVASKDYGTNTVR